MQRNICVMRPYATIYTTLAQIYGDNPEEPREFKSVVTVTIGRVMADSFVLLAVTLSISKSYILIMRLRK